MRLATGSSAADGAAESPIQLVLSQSDVEQFQETLPWLLRALAPRPDTTPRPQARRAKAQSLLQRLLEVLPAQEALAAHVTPVDGQLEPK